MLPNVDLETEIRKYLAMDMGFEEIERSLLRRVKDYRYKRVKPISQIDESNISDEESLSSKDGEEGKKEDDEAKEKESSMKTRKRDEGPSIFRDSVGSIGSSRKKKKGLENVKPKKASSTPSLFRPIRHFGGRSTCETQEEEEKLEH